MCGIAGYNVSKELASDGRFDGERQFQAIKQAWEHNEHRGRSACGYFRVDLEDDITYIEKEGWPASKLLHHLEKENKVSISPSYVLGVHTRAATKGDHKINDNNHPVQWDGVVVTHNGVIQNDEDIKDKYVTAKKRKIVPEVDTAAIAILLSHCQPYNYDEIVEALQELRGGFAIHAVWADEPGLSLFVRGDGYPLILRYDDRGMMSYGSEDVSTWHMLAAMGIDPNASNFSIREMDNHTAVWVKDGKPIHWNRWRVAWTSASRMAFERTRLLPSNDPKVKPEEIYSTDMATDFAFVKYHSIQAVDKEDTINVKLLYMRNVGFSDECNITSFPLPSDISVWAKVGEADEVWSIVSQDTLHALYGNIEVVMRRTDGKVLDIFNHDLFDMQDRWIDSDQEEEIVAVRTDDWRPWLIKNSSSPRHICRQPTPSEWSRMLEKYQKDEAFKRQKKQKAKSQANEPRTLAEIQEQRRVAITDGKPDPFDSDKARATTTSSGEIKVGRSINYANYETDLKKHTTENIWFFSDIKCALHQGTYFSEHQEPKSCKNIMIAYMSVLSSVTDLVLFMELDPEGFKFNYTESEKGDCPESESHDWQTFYKRRIWLNDTHYLSIPTAEKCTKCNALFRVKEYPLHVKHYLSNRKEDQEHAAV